MEDCPLAKLFVFLGKMAFHLNRGHHDILFIESAASIWWEDKSLGSIGPEQERTICSWTS